MSHRNYTRQQRAPIQSPMPKTTYYDTLSGIWEPIEDQIMSELRDMVWDNVWDQIEKQSMENINETNS